jgi:small GTP-binding protein
MNLKTKWLLLGLVLTLPYAVLTAAGVWWFYKSGWALWWLAGAAATSLIGWPLTRWLRQRTPIAMPATAGPSTDWSPAGRDAWAEVEAIAVRVKDDDLPLDRPDAVINVAREVIESVARKFHARSKNPVLEIPVPHLLQIVELVARDLRETCSNNIPGSHILTINDLQKLKKLFYLAPTLSRLYRLAALIVNPAGALVRELNALAVDQIMSASTAETKRWLVQFAVRRLGFYAIELYSGHLVLRGIDFQAYTTGSSRRAIEEDKQRTAAFEQEPLRILVLGQVKAGKSSLVNALFGETKAAVDVVPRTSGVEPYLLERDGLRRAIILDTAGYEDATRTATALNDAREEIERCDLVVLVCSAGMVARDADRRLLNEVRGWFQDRPDREFPPLIVAVTHIDQVRPFREWNPPYDLTEHQNPKARQIRDAIEAVATDLAVEVECVIPVCLLERQLYNIDEGLIPAILNSLAPARRLQYLRCLREFRDEEYWRQLRQQAVNAGRILVQAGRQLLGSAKSSNDPTEG